VFEKFLNQADFNKITALVDIMKDVKNLKVGN
jgi:hypothetical protein